MTSRVVAHSRALLARPEVRFLLVGGINTAVGLAAFAVLYTLFPDTLHYLGALVLAYVIGICVGFMLQRRLVFRVRGRVLGDLWRYTSVQCVALGLNSLLLPFFVEVLHLPVLLAQVVSLGLVVVSSWFAHRSFSFSRPGEP